MGGVSRGKKKSASVLQRSRGYPEYKDSGVEWLGKIPKHWELKVLKRLASLRSGVAITSTNVDRSGEFPVFGGNGIRGFTSTYTHEGCYPLIGRQGALCGCVSFASGRFWASEHAVVATPQAEIDPYWLTYLLRAMALNSYSESAAQPGLAVDTISVLRVPVPRSNEQRAIAAYLDQETTRIDALETKKERMIELLQEKRTALITRAVTKGLDPNAPVKDSGVEWLGKIPAHWEVKRVRHIIDGLEQGWSPECENREADDDEWGVLKAGCVNRGVFNPREHKALPAGLEPLPELEIKPGDLLMSRASGSRDLVGSVALVSSTRSKLLLCDKLFRLSPKGVGSSFLAHALSSRLARWQIEIALSGGSGLANNIPQEVVKDLIVLLPPKGEQNAITAFVDRETARIDVLVAKIQEAIARLKELRTALISAAVTGKIDVREEAA